MEIKLQYMGSRPYITPTGITFKTGKEDKYVYVNHAADILHGLEVLSHTNEYIHQMHTNRFDDDEIFEFVSQCEPNVKENIQKEIGLYEKHLDDQIEQIKHQKRFEPIEIHSFVGNLKVMKKYRIQRAINKIIYMHIIDAIIKIVKEKNIKKIETPFCEKFWHILHTLEEHIFTSAGGMNSNYSIKEDTATSTMKIELNFTHFN